MGQKERAELLSAIGEQRGSVALMFVVGARVNMAAQIAPDAIEPFVHHLDSHGVVKRISLVLSTNGGDILTAWNLSNLLHSFCDELEVIVPNRAMSAGTLLCLAAKTIVMTKQATLGPIDPTVNNPLSPKEGNQRIGVSVEDLNGYLDFVRSALPEKADIEFALERLSHVIHPLVLGQAHRAREQIRMLGTRLLEASGHDAGNIDAVMAFLCGEARSHDYTVNRREAQDRLKLPVEKASDGLYDLLSKLWKDVKQEMELDAPFTHLLVEAGKTQDYNFPRVLLESAKGGSHQFVSAGTLTKMKLPTGAVQFNDDRKQEGWIYANPVA